MKKLSAYFLIFVICSTFSACGSLKEPTALPSVEGESIESLISTDTNAAEISDTSNGSDASENSDVSESSDASNASDASITSDASMTSDAFTESDSFESSHASEESTPSLNLIMVGDILLHTPVEESSLTQDGSYDYSAIFANTKDMISEADLALVNQEVIIGGKDLGVSGYPAFNAPYEIGDALVETGFDVVCHATNHALDKGKKGLLNCLNFWEESYPEITVLGVHKDQESQDSIYIYDAGDFTLAILNFTYGTNGIALPGDMPYAVDLLDTEKTIAAIRKAEEIADFTIVCPHWGTEYRLEPDNSQQKWAKLFLENGVDLVLGTHPHVIEPVELLTDEATGQEMLVYYSLGNYVNWTSGTGAGVANRMVGGMAQVTITKNAEQKAVISSYGIRPLICHVSEGPEGVTVYPIEEYSEELAKNNRMTLQDPAFTYDYCINLCNKVWGELWQDITD